MPSDNDNDNDQKEDLFSWFLGWVSVNHPVSKVAGIFFVVTVALYYASKYDVNVKNLDKVLPYIIFVVVMTPFFIFIKQIKKIRKSIKDFFTVIYLIAFFGVVGYYFCFKFFHTVAPHKSTNDEVITDISNDSIAPSPQQNPHQETILFDTLELLFDGDDIYTEFEVDGQPVDVITYSPIVIRVERSKSPQQLICWSENKICKTSISHKANRQRINIVPNLCDSKN